MFEPLEDRRLMSATALASPATSAYAEQDTVQASQTVRLAAEKGTGDTASRGCVNNLKQLSLATMM